MKRILGLLIPALVVLVTLTARAAIISNTYSVTATNFGPVVVHPCPGPAPVDPVKLAFSITFDNSVNIPETAANLTIISFNLNDEFPVRYAAANDNLALGDGPTIGETVTGHDNFELQLLNMSTTAKFGELFYTVSSPSLVAPCRFASGTGIVIAGPPWTHLPFPMLGIRLGQIIRVNVVEGPVPVPGPGPLCQAQLNIYDAHNNLVASQSVSPPGSVSFNLDPRTTNAALGRGGGREELRPEVILVPNSTPTPDSPPAAACQGQATAEVYDFALKSTTLITPALSEVPQLPAVQLGPVGVGFLQTVRLNVVAYPPSPCVGTLSFTDTQGNPIRGSTPVNLTAGQAAFADLPGTAVPSDSGHGEVMAVFTQAQTPASALQGTCIPSVEVYDQSTGVTQALISPEARPVPIP
jgi:hypothetical protein